MAKTSDVPAGEMICIDVEGAKVGIANVDGTFYAISDICPHRGCAIPAGPLKGLIATCDCHGSEFDVTNGAVIAGPAREPLQTYAVTVQGDELIVQPS